MPGAGLSGEGGPDASERGKAFSEGTAREASPDAGFFTSLSQRLGDVEQPLTEFPIRLFGEPAIGHILAYTSSFGLKRVTTRELAWMLWRSFPPS